LNHQERQNEKCRDWEPDKPKGDYEMYDINMTFNSIFKEANIGGIQIPNRVVFPAVNMNRANQDGTISESIFNFYRQLASGECGLIIVGAAAVSSTTLAFDRLIRIDKDDYVPGLKRLFSEIHARGRVPGIQLIHYGRQAASSVTGHPLPAPSAIPCPVTSQYDPDYQVVEMSLTDIQQVIGEFVSAAVRAVSAGAALVEIHAAHGYLLNEFLSPYSNKRTDAYGGDAERRIRIIVEILQGIRAKLANRCAISVRVSANEYVEGGLTPNDFAGIVPELDQAGMDMLNVSAGVYESMEKVLKGDASHVHLARELATYTSKPVCAVGSIMTLAQADEIVRAGHVDMTAMARAQIADPDLVRKSRLGRAEQIRRCTQCNQCTFWTIGDPYMYCPVNPEMRREATQ
jgi:2,4-dienoyl-CoA reductase-like NADH-dependent reductase (Old Yellow Enzyme family)